MGYSIYGFNRTPLHHKLDRHQRKQAIFNMFSSKIYIVVAVVCTLVSVHAQHLIGNNQRRELQNIVRRSRASIFELQDEAEVCKMTLFVDKFLS